MSETLSKMMRFSGFAGAGRVDKERNVIESVSMAQKGPALGHGVMFDDRTIDQAVELSVVQMSGIKSRFTHPGLSSDGLGSYLGRVRNIHRANDKAVGDLHLSEMAFTSPRGDLGNYVMGMAEKEPGAFGMSLVTLVKSTVWAMEDGSEVLHFDYETGTKGEKQKPNGARYDLPSVRFAAVRAVDLVDEPAANRDGLFSGALVGTNVLAESLFEDFDLLLSQMGVSYERAFQFAVDYFAARGVTPEHLRTGAAFDGVHAENREIDSLREYVRIFSRSRS